MAPWQQDLPAEAYPDGIIIKSEAYLDISIFQGVWPCTQEVSTDHAAVQLELLQLRQRSGDLMGCSIIHLSHSSKCSLGDMIC